MLVSFTLFYTLLIYYMPQKKCLICNTVFHKKPSDIKRGKGKFCSLKCFGIWESQNRKGNNNPNWKGGKIKRNCLICNKIFYKTLFFIKKGQGKYCSLACMHNSQKRENNHFWKGGRLKRECIVCHKIFYIYPSRLKYSSGIYCSCRCRGSEMCGNKNIKWLGGRAQEPYSIDWKETLRRSIRERDRYTCQICNKQQDKIALDVHHIDRNKLNSNPNNLITLCRKCHLIIHREKGSIKI